MDIVHQTAHRGGKTVTVQDGCMEIQGNKREEMKRILTEAGFKPVFAVG